ncbi:MFS transporter [Actinoallomurus iriomotensis]|uniref:MFS transporter n=1 Tax=Actinoallomurus iriomotensis TaxID=478107 RepID=UPI00255404C7|nr:MFS transporter [Actinoallomurus iriomotensis]
MTSDQSDQVAGGSGQTEFRLILAAAVVSLLGTQIGFVAIPLVAVSALRASPGQVGLLATLSTVAFLLVGLPAGAWVDRLRRRPVMITADLARTVLLGSVPVAWWIGELSLLQLDVVVFLTGVGTVFFDVASQSYLPHVVGRDRLTAANAALVSADAVSDVVGRGLGGLMVQALSAPVAVGVDAASFLWSAACLWRVRRRETASPRGGPARLWQEIAQGLRFVVGQPFLRAIALSGALVNLSLQLILTLLPVLFVRDLHLPARTLGAYLGAGGIGLFLGARLAEPVGRRLGPGRTPWILGAVLGPASLAIPFVDHGPALWIAGVAWLLTMTQLGVNNVILVGFRQRITPDPLLGRMNATMRFLLFGALALGSGLAGLLGEFAGTRTALWAGAIVMSLAWLPLFLVRFTK